MADVGSDPTTDVSDETIEKLGSALKQVTQIQETYMPRFEAAQTDDVRKSIDAEAQAVMVTAVRDQGLSVEQFNDLITAAQKNPELRQRVTAAANAA